MPRKRAEIDIRPRIRVIKGENIVMGPGKADLLEAIDHTGSIRQAAAELGMSYMRAWTLVRTMNASFREPVVESSRGGSGRGGAILTRSGRAALDLYREMERESVEASSKATRKLVKLVK